MHFVQLSALNVRGGETNIPVNKMKDVIISIKGMQSCGEDGDDAAEFVTDGQYSYADGCGTLSYMESELTGLEGTRTSLTFDPRRMIIEREGTVNMRMIFEPGQRHTFLYETPYGTATMAVDTRCVRAELNEHGGELEIDYVVNFDNAAVGRNSFSISVREPNA